MTKSLLFTFALALLVGCGAGDESDGASTADGLKYIGAVLSVTTTGAGRVTSAPAGIDCSSTCRAPFEWSSAVELTATPAPGASFAGWSGVCSGTATKCTVTMSGARSVSAAFSASAPPPSGTFGPNTPEGQGYADGAAATANSAAFQRAVDHADANGERVILSKRVYTYAGNVHVPPALEILGASSDLSTGTVLVNTAATPHFVQGESESVMVMGNRFQRFALKDGTTGFVIGPNGAIHSTFMDLHVSIPGGEGFRFTGGAEQVLFDQITCTNTSVCVHGALNTTRESRWDKSTFRHFTASNVGQVFKMEMNLMNDLRFEDVTMKDVSSDGALFAGEIRALVVIGGSSTNVAGASWKIGTATWPNTANPTYAGWITFKDGVWGTLDLAGSNNEVLLDHATYASLRDPSGRARVYSGASTAAPSSAPEIVPTSPVLAATPEANGYADGNSGAANAAAFAKAFEYASAHAVPVALRRHHYTYAGPITVPSGVTVIGMGSSDDLADKATVLENKTSTTHFEIAGNDVRFEDLSIMSGATALHVGKQVSGLTLFHVTLKVWGATGIAIESALTDLHVDQVMCAGMAVCVRATPASSLSQSGITDLYAVNDTQVLHLEGPISNVTFAGMRMHSSPSFSYPVAASQAYVAGAITNMSVVGGFEEMGKGSTTWELHPAAGSTIRFEGGHWGSSLTTTQTSTMTINGPGSSVSLLNVNAGNANRPVRDPDYVTAVMPAGSITVLH